jgi:hypothetical protein
MPEAGPYSAAVGCASLGLLAGGIGLGQRRLGSCHAHGCTRDCRSNGDEQLSQRQRAARRRGDTGRWCAGRTRRLQFLLELKLQGAGD